MDAYRFSPEELAPEDREPGISAVMRLRDSEDFLEAVVESHVAHFDEIVAVHNQCTDATPEILSALEARHPGKLRVFHYEPRVHPSGTPEYRAEPADSPHSLVNYSNYALARTTRRIVTLLDDDHLAIEANLARLVERIRDRVSLGRVMWCTSGFNIDLHAGRLGVRARAPFAGNGDHGFFEVNERTRFERARRFERLRYEELDRRFEAFTYWHLKHLKKDHGYGNYELETNPESRYARHRERFLANRETIEIETFLGGRRPFARLARAASALPLPDRTRLRLARHGSLAGAVSNADVETLRRCLSDRVGVQSSAAPMQ